MFCQDSDIEAAIFIDSLVFIERQYLIQITNYESFTLMHQKITLLHITQ